jgi:hypothetical protein
MMHTNYPQKVQKNLIRESESDKRMCGKMLKVSESSQQCKIILV